MQKYDTIHFVTFGDGGSESGLRGLKLQAFNGKRPKNSFSDPEMRYSELQPAKHPNSGG